MTRKRRGRGESSIFRRKDGRWVAELERGYNAAGKRLRLYAYGRTKTEVQQKLRKLASETVLADQGRLTVADHLRHWLEHTAKPKVAPTTHLRYSQIIRLHIEPHIGGLRLDKLTPFHVEQLFATQERKKVSARNRQLSGVVLSSACKSAVRLRLLAHNPCSDVTKPRPAKREMQVLDPKQARRFLDEAAKEVRVHALFVLAVVAGLRQGELFGLQWGDIDFAGKSLSVQRTLEEIAGVVRLKEPKTGKSRRRIDLPELAVNALLEHRRVMLAEGHAAGPVFCAPGGGYWLKSNFTSRCFKPLLKRAELPPIRFHDLRHTSASLLLLAGENPKVVSEMLGHAGIEITLSVYSHVLPSMGKAAAEKFDKMFA